ncbi:ASKHA domain-containing protein [bacterium]|nr:ASKHA domain-containing protein [bacterium]MCI0606701.1 ASKHA domain-containing protein [bacterium]
MKASLTIDNISTEADIGTSIFDCAETINVTVPTSCIKQGKCRECLVEIECGTELLTPLTPQESHLGGRFRLACRTRFAEPGEVRCHTLRRGSLRIETETSGLSQQPMHLDPAVTRSGNSILLDGEPIAESDQAIHGVAIDIGTTTVALRLYDLENGHLIATQSFENPQRFGGSDIMARIHFDGEHGGRLLQRTLLGYLTRAITSLPVDPMTIHEITVVGNPTMRDLFFGLNVQSIGVMPYRSTTEAAFHDGLISTTSLSLEARRLRLPVPPRARVYGLPLIGSHVGADAAACLLASGIAESDEICAILDIGTNTEAILGNRHRIMAASCPAGPAFEGGGVVFGMPALDGAIERVRLEDDNVQTTVIQNGKPLGICGSGLVDLLSELLRTEQMNEQGRLTDDREIFMVDSAHQIFVGEADINELAQAKGANAAGLRVLAESYGIEMGNIEKLYLAGGFSRHLDVDAAARIGLIPDLRRERIQQVGNAALQGAAMALLSRAERQKLEEIVKRIEHVRLETNPHFFDFFVEGCQFQSFGRTS